MKWKVFALLPILGGCLAPASTIYPPEPSTTPPPASVALLDPDLSSSSDIQNFTLQLPANESAGGTEELAPVIQPYSGPNLEKVAASLSLLEGEEVLANIDLEEELPDPETMEDNLIISGTAENPPEDEGKTVAAGDEVSFDFPMVENEKVHYYVNYFTGPAREVFTRWMERSRRYLPLMQQVFAEEGLPLDLVYLAMVESGFNNRAYSRAHAAGPWQFIASTGRYFGLDADWWRDERRDFEKATRGAARFLKELHAKFNGNWYLAVASYNAGPGKIQRAIQMYDTTDFWEISRGPYLAMETKNYLPKLLAVLLIAKQPEKYGFTDVKYMEPVAYDLVHIPTATDLEIVASYCEVSYQEIKDLNPELKRWCTPPSVQNYPLRIPAGKKEQFEQQFSLLPEGRRANYQRHRVQKGDSLRALAKRYKIRVDDIAAMNRIVNPRALRIGADLILPLRQGLSKLPLQELGNDPEERASKARRTYSVRKGDSLSKIARKFNVSEGNIREWNRLSKKSILRIGQVLNLAAPSRARAPDRTARTNAGRKTIYEVRSGDTLWKIARQFGVREEEIRQWNNLSRKQPIKVGQKLALRATAATAVSGQTPAKGKAPAAAAGKTVASSGKTAKTAGKTAGKKIIYRVRPGDNLWNISRKFAVETREILGWNKLDESHVLQPGDELTLMVQGGKG